MKKYCLIIAFFVIFGVFGGANAALVPYGTDAIRDTTTGLLWWKDLSDFAGQYYATKQDMIEGLEGGIGWHMATEDEMLTLFREENPEYTVVEVLTVFLPCYPGYIEEGPGRYVEDYFGSWQDNYDIIDPNAHRMTTYRLFDTEEVLTFSGGLYGMGTDLGGPGSIYWGAWATRSVPIPGAVWIFGSGLIGIVGVRRKFKK